MLWQYTIQQEQCCVFPPSICHALSGTMFDKNGTYSLALSPSPLPWNGTGFASPNVPSPSSSPYELEGHH